MLTTYVSLDVDPTHVVKLLETKLIMKFR